MKNRISLVAVIVLMAATVGCMSTKHKTTTSNGSVTESSATGLLVTVDGYEDQAVSPDGILTRTAVKRIAGDVEMMKAITDFAATMGKMMLMASGSTNAVIIAPVTNAVTSYGFAPRAPK